jgi:hypothetical protein
MPVRYSFEDVIFKMVPEGEYSPQDMIDCFDTALADPAFPANARYLLDVSRADSLVKHTNSDMLQILGYFIPRSDRVGRKCALVAKPQVHYGKMRMAAAWGQDQGLDVRVFRVYEEAVRWLKGESEVERISLETPG